MSCYLQVLGEGSPSYPFHPSIFLFLDSSRYLFGGVGEGLQRLCTEGAVKLSRTSNVFLTRIASDTVGGLTGLLITLADLGLTRVGLHGPGSIAHFLQATRHVSVRSGITIQAGEVTVSSTNDDNCCTTSKDKDTDTDNGNNSSNDPSKPHYQDANLSVDVIILAEHDVPLPPIRPARVPRHARQKQREEQKRMSHTAASSLNEHKTTSSTSPTNVNEAFSMDDDEPADPSIDDSCMIVDDDSPPPPKKAKHTHRIRQTSSSRPSADTADATPMAASVAAAAPAAPDAASPVPASASGSTAPFSSPSAPATHSPRSTVHVSQWVRSVRPSLVSYIVTLASQPGKFDLARARSLGIPPGPLYAKLKAGHSIQIHEKELIKHGAKQTVNNRTQKKPKNNQKQVKGDANAAAAANVPADPPSTGAAADLGALLTFHPSDCVAPPVPGAKFGIVDVPNVAFVDALVSHPAFRKYQVGAKTNSQLQESSMTMRGDGATSSPSDTSYLSFIFHYSPLSILRDQRYQAWMRAFDPRTQHVFVHSSISALGTSSSDGVNGSVSAPVFRSAALNYLKMKTFINHDIFPVHVPIEGHEHGDVADRMSDDKSFAKKPTSASINPFSSIFDAELAARCHLGRNLQRFHLLPIRPHPIDCIDSSTIPSAITWHELEEKLREGSNECSIQLLKAWSSAMKDGRAAGRGIEEIAEEFRLKHAEQIATAATTTASSQSDPMPSTSGNASLPTPDIGLVDPSVLDGWNPPSGGYLAAHTTPDPSSPSSSSSGPSLSSSLPSPSSFHQRSDWFSPEFLFLGTGSAIPSKYRNVTGQFFHPGYHRRARTDFDDAHDQQAHTRMPMPAHPIGGFILDCGEGSIGQLCMRYASALSSSSSSSPSSLSIVSNLIADLKCVWISHIHADHHLGLLSILTRYRSTWIQRFKQRHGTSAEALTKLRLVSSLNWQPDANIEGVDSCSSLQVPKLVVIGPHRLFPWLNEYAACAFDVDEEDMFHTTPSFTRDGASILRVDPVNPSIRSMMDWIEFIPCSALQARHHPHTSFFARPHPFTQTLYPSAPTPRSADVFHTVQAKHCYDAYGLVIESKGDAAAASPSLPSSSLSASSLRLNPPYKLVVSGDTQPCQSLIDAGADATLLIHESTFEAEMIEEAAEKRHSTSQQALEVARRMRAERLILTHFSQRYPKIPSLSNPSFNSSHSLSASCVSIAPNTATPSGRAPLVGLAFDLMCFRFSQLSWIPSLTSAFSWVYDERELEKNYEKSKIKKQKALDDE